MDIQIPTQTDRYRHRQTDTDTDRQAHTQTDTYTRQEGIPRHRPTLEFAVSLWWMPCWFGCAAGAVMIGVLKYFATTARLPFCIRVLLEAALRNCDGRTVTTENVEAILNWEETSNLDVEIPFKPARVVMQDFTSVALSFFWVFFLCAISPASHRMSCTLGSSGVGLECQ